MTNQIILDDALVSNGFNEVWVQFWKTYRDNPPERCDRVAWGHIEEQSEALQGKYPFMAEAIIDLEFELKRRSWEGEDGK